MMAAVVTVATLAAALGAALADSVCDSGDMYEICEMANPGEMQRAAWTREQFGAEPRCCQTCGPVRSALPSSRRAAAAVHTSGGVRVTGNAVFLSNPIDHFSFVPPPQGCGERARGHGLMARARIVDAHVRLALAMQRAGLARP